MTSLLQSLEVMGKRFVLLEQGEYERLCREAGGAANLADRDLPPFPQPDKNGRLPALEYASVALARDLIRARKGVSLSQQRLAQLAGIRQETVSRLETGKHTASPRTVTDRSSEARGVTTESGRGGGGGGNTSALVRSATTQIAAAPLEKLGSALKTRVPPLNNFATSRLHFSGQERSGSDRGSVTSRSGSFRSVCRAGRCGEEGAAARTGPAGVSRPGQGTGRRSGRPSVPSHQPGAR